MGGSHRLIVRVSRTIKHLSLTRSSDVFSAGFWLVFAYLPVRLVWLCFWMTYVAFRCLFLMICRFFTGDVYECLIVRISRTIKHPLHKESPPLNRARFAHD